MAPKVIQLSAADKAEHAQLQSVATSARSAAIAAEKAVTDHLNQVAGLDPKNPIATTFRKSVSGCGNFLIVGS